ncbi:LamG domain-containing protein [bacterium]|nr:LamG domain-containing protein [bacterium]
MRKNVLLMFTAILLWSLSSSAENFRISINDVSGLNTAWPIIASIPFPEGNLTDSSNIRIMSGEKEVPSQIDVTATWRDGSIRWALAGFTASPQGNYRVEFGEGIKRGRYPNPLKVTEQPNGGFEVNTGVAIYRFAKNQLLPEEGWLISGREKRQILENSGAGAYLIDNANREARVSGEASEITNEILKEGSNRLAIKRSGWYVTTSGEKLARADIWLYFTAGVPYVRITHTLIFTEDTNKVWFKDYGLEFKTPEQPKDTYFSLGEPGKKETVSRIINNSDETYILQTDYPHFAEREYQAIIGRNVNNKDTTVLEKKVAGDWGYGDYGSYGITLVMPWLAERFPKEISFGQRGARAVLWSGRSGKELDFRAKTLVKEYWQTWAEKGLGSPGAKKLSEFESNAQGSARTHDIWFLPHLGEYKEDLVRKTATAGARQVLALADPVWLCNTEAMGYPMLHKDVERFPEEENAISEYWQRFILPLRAFPHTGYIDWGNFPTWSYDSVGGRIMARFHILCNIDRYSVRREPWRLFARSGERTYYDYAHRFSRFSGDWYLIHHNSQTAPMKRRGHFMFCSQEGGKLPFAWGQTGNLYLTNGGDIGCWLLEYYLAGDERSFELLKMLKESVKKRWKSSGAIAVNQSKVVRELVTLSIMDWDEDIMQMSKEVTHSMFDLESQNGIKMFKHSYGPMYKDHRTSHNTVEYYLETKDELAKEAFLKLMDQRYRFDRRTSFVSYKNYSGFTSSIAYWLTGEERHLVVAEQSIKDAVRYIKEQPLSKTLKTFPADPLDWKKMPDYLGIWEWHNPFIGLPTALKLLSEGKSSGKSMPLIVQCVEEPKGEILFLHKKGVDTKLNICIKIKKDLELLPPKIISYKTRRDVKGIKTEFEKIMERGPFFTKKPDVYPVYSDTFHLNVTVPSETPEGLYRLFFTQDVTFTLLDINTQKVALYCPEGFWSISIGQHTGEGSYGRFGEGMPAYFKVPAHIEKLEILIGSQCRIRRPDGSVALDMSDDNIGRQNISVEGKPGVWSIEPCIYNIRGTCAPSFVRLINVEPIVSFGSASLLPEVAPEKFVKTKEEVVEFSPVEFVNGLTGRALHLSQNSKISFSRGEEVAGNEGYEFFPVKKGTIEFWFKSDRSNYETPIKHWQLIYTNFVKGPNVAVNHRYKFFPTIRNIDSVLRTEILPEKTGQFKLGFQGRCFLKRDEWVHLAFTWDVKEGEKNMDGELTTFVNGSRINFNYTHLGLNSIKNSKSFKLSKEEQNVTIGPFDGTMDLLRISDIVRYAEDFKPSKKYGLDKNTRVFFNFDGNLKGVSAFTKALVEAK